MKKIISFLLVIMLLSSISVSAFASDVNVIGMGTATDTYNSKTATTTDTPDVSTQLWLQVLAEGQIDVTIPLNLVFKTNIDGGDATKPDVYYIQNNNNAPVAVTAMTATSQTNDMELVAYSFTAASGEGANATPAKYNFAADDQYMVKFFPENYTNTATANGIDLKNIPAADTSTKYIFKLNANDRQSNDAAKTYIDVEMATSPLTFVTKTDANGAAMGLKLLNVTYTVGIDPNPAAAKGEAIEDTISFN